MGAPLNNKYPQKYTPQMIEDLCNELIDFAEEDGTVHFIEFARRKKKTQSWLNRMEEDYPEFKDAYTTAKELLAGKLVRTSIYGHPTNPNFNGTHAMSWKNVYSKVQQNYDKWKAEIAKEIPKQEECHAEFKE